MNISCKYNEITRQRTQRHEISAILFYRTRVLVAKEMLNAESGGQWLLSCFAPLKDKPCIPGMEDLSPEEVRWEMYHAQNNGMVEQAVSIYCYLFLL